MLASLMLAGCTLDRGAIAPDPRADAGPVPDARDGERDARVERDGQSEPCVPSAEICDGLDNDCDPTTADGADEVTLGDPCDDPADAGRCPDGRIECVGGVLVCAGDDGDQADEVELCDGLDNDCDPTTPDGADEETLGDPCDDPSDADLCADGRVECVGGALVCSGDDGDQPNEVELCDGLDNDCNPDTPDGAMEPPAECDGPDGDVCNEGVFECRDGLLVCNDATDTITETCDGEDDDCDEVIDEDAGCPCTHVTNGRRAYLFCDPVDDWSDAAAFCSMRGYHLAKIEDAAEQAFVTMIAASISSQPWWIGLNDSGREGTYVWADGSSLGSYAAWADGQPNGTGDCVAIEPSMDIDGTTMPGGWNDRECWRDTRFVCEAGP